jgi:outer membrane protein, multidrug efflux system
LPSDLLDRRPDIRAAEQLLVAANADIGQAKAAFFPKVTLTGFYGFQSVALSDLFTSGSQTWQFGPAVSLPVFTGGALRGNLKLAQARFEEAVAQYQKTVQNSFREVSDSLIAYQRTREFRARLEGTRRPIATRRSSPTSAMKVGLPATSRCSTTSRSSSPPS